MTEAVGAGNPAAIDIAAQMNTAKAGTRKPTDRSAAKPGDKTSADDAPEVRETKQKTDGPDTKKRAGSVNPISRSERGDARKSDGEDESFEATIDSVDRDTGQIPKADATQTNSQTAAPNALLAAAQVALVPESGDQPVETQAPQSSGARLPIMPNMLKQDSIAALLAARERLLSGNAAPSPGADQEETASSPMVVESRETHWRFAAPVAAPSERAATTPAPAVAATVAMASAAAPRAADAGERGPESGETAGKSSPAMVGKPTPQVSDPVAGVAGQTSGGQGNSGFGSHDGATAESDSKRVADIGPAKAVDQTSSDEMTAAAPASVAQQVGSGIAAALSPDAGDASSAPVSNISVDRPAAPAQVLRTIDLTLQPADLGSVRLKLTLASNTLTIEAETSKAATAKLLNDDRNGLEQSLRDAGYDVSGLKITDAAAASTSSSANGSSTSGSPFQDGTQNRQAFAERRDGDLGRRDGAMPDQGQQRSKGNDRHPPPASDVIASRQPSGVYI